MTFLEPDDLLIDCAHIWQHEQTLYQQQKSSKAFIEDLHRFLAVIFLTKQHKPFISKEKVADNPSLHDYHQNYLRNYPQQKDWFIDYFEHEGAFYDMNVSCPVAWGEIADEHFCKLFALQLRHFEGNPDEVTQFLSFHLYTSFQRDVAVCRSFFHTLLSLHQDLLSPALLATIRTWTSLTLNLLSKEDSYVGIAVEKEPFWQWIKLVETEKGEESVSVIRLADEEEDEEEENKSDTTLKAKGEGADAAEPIDDSNANDNRSARPFVDVGPIANPYRWEEHEIRHFFSFLCKDRGDGKAPLLSEEQVNQMLEHGLTVPEHPLEQKFSLSTTKHYTLTLVRYFVYQFYLHYNEGKKKQILQFLGSYLEDFAPALKGETYQNLNANIRDIPPKQTGNGYVFTIEEWIPEDIYRQKNVRLLARELHLAQNK